MNSLNIVLISCGAQFPNGSGATARILAYCRGLRQNGSSVHVLCLKATEAWSCKAQDFPIKGSYEGIPFEYTCGRRICGRTRLARAWLYFKGVCGAMRALYQIQHRSRVDVIHYYGQQEVFGTFAVWCAARFTRGLLVVEKVEFPFIYCRNGLAVKLKRLLATWLLDKLPDGLIVISSFLMEYYRGRVRKDCKVLLVPSLVEMEMYPEVSKRPENMRRTVIYCGNLYNDGEVERLLQAFALASKNQPHWNLQIIGDTSDTQRLMSLTAAAAKLNLNGRVEFVGAVSRKEIPHWLVKGDIMALPRASGTFSAAGFPTKLAEYLATGRPVVVTATGDIPRYLESGVNAYVVPPDDTDAFADCLRYVMIHPEEAAVVGSRGRQTAMQVLNCRTHCQRILNFLSELRKTQTERSPGTSIEIRNEGVH